MSLAVLRDQKLNGDLRVPAHRILPPNPARFAKIAACDRAYRFLQNLLLPLSNPKVLSLVTIEVTCLN
jgi:hypothetical protein